MQETTDTLCRFHKITLVEYNGALVCARCLNRNYGIRLRANSDS